MKKKLILISGLNCTGKTSLSRHLFREKFFVFLINRDEIKESLFDSLGYKDREWSKKLGAASYGIMFQLINSFFKSKDVLAAESNFNSKLASEKVFELKEKHNFDLIQIICKAEGQILFERFKKRSESGERHPGHRDHLNYKEFESILSNGSYEPLDVESEILEVDTTDFEKIDYERIYSFLRKHLPQKLRQ